MKLAWILPLALGVGLSTAANGQSHQLKPAQVAHKYRLSAGDGKKSDCVVTLALAATGDGRVLDLSDACRDRFGLQSVSSWRLHNNAIIFVSEGGAPIASFQEDDEVEAGEGGFVFSETNGGTRYLSQWRGK